MSGTTGTEATVERLPACDVCGSGTTAKYDAKTKAGPWGFLCQQCFDKHGIGLGTGKGQRLIQKAGAGR